jgi:hypothetical protein
VNNKKLTPEERQLRKIERIKEKQKLERKRREQKRLANADKLKQKAAEELRAMNNEVTVTDQAKKVREKLEKKTKPIVGTSKHNKKWEEKRKERYNQRVWKGWRESDGKQYPVTVRKERKGGGKNGEA